jgi:hypothetical protein
VVGVMKGRRLLRALAAATALACARARGLALVGVLAVAAAGCASPTLPLPPPAIPTVETSAIVGHVHLSSTRGAEPNAIIVIVNPNPALAGDARAFASQADEEGTWDAEVTASKGDVLEITQEYGTTRSPSVTIQIR